jgi:hypothetical protein
MEVEVLYSISPRGYELPNEILEQYNLKSPNKKEYGFLIDRHDILLIDIVKQLKDTNPDMVKYLKIQNIPFEYIDCYTIEKDEYSGEEFILCEINRLVINKLLKLDLDSISNEKLREEIDLLQKMLI